MLELDILTKFGSPFTLLLVALAAGSVSAFSGETFDVLDSTLSLEESARRVSEDPVHVQAYYNND